MTNNTKKAKKEWVRGLSPDTVVWEITLACNMRCIHCGSSASQLTKRRDELTTAEALGAIRQLKEIGTNRIVLSGGEPFIRRDWDALAAEIARLGITPSFISNGFLINEQVAEKIKALNRPNAHVGISVDGDEETHDYIRQTKGSFKRAIGAMDILREKGILVSAITQVNKINFRVLDKIRDFVFGHGVYAWQIQLATPWGRLAKTPKLIFTPKDYMELMKYIVGQKKLYGEKIVAADDIGYYTELENTIRPKGEWQGCHAGVRVLGLTSNGGVTGCLSLQEKRFIEGNVRKRKLKDIWYDPELFSYNRDFKESDLKGFCRQCPHRLKCRGGCKNTSYSFSRCLCNNFFCAFRIMMGKSPDKIAVRRGTGLGQYHP
jgi:radical SAM protein with 4Fe4S-binding SPASM domain